MGYKIITQALNSLGSMSIIKRKFFLLSLPILMFSALQIHASMTCTITWDTVIGVGCSGDVCSATVYQTNIQMDCQLDPVLNDGTGGLTGPLPDSGAGVGTDYDTDNGVMDCWMDITPGASISSPYGPRNFGDGNHAGVDVTSSSHGNPYGHGNVIRAMADGTVSATSATTVRGNFVTVNNDNGSQTVTMHMEESWVSVGQSINAGQIIGTMNCTGNCGGAVGSANRGRIESTHAHIANYTTHAGDIVADEYEDTNNPIEEMGGETCEEE